MRVGGGREGGGRGGKGGRESGTEREGKGGGKGFAITLLNRPRISSMRVWLCGAGSSLPGENLQQQNLISNLISKINKFNKFNIFYKFNNKFYI